MKPELVFVAAAAWLALGNMAIAQNIGVTSSVRNTVNGDLSGIVRNLGSGDGVSQNETISTGEDSATQLLFEDRTSVTLGENARLTLNKFVYNPAQNTGEVIVRATKGAFRFVSGLATNKKYTVETPRVTIGIRGSIIEGFIDEDTGREVIVLIQGTIDVCEQPTDCVVADEPGTFVQVTESGDVTQPAGWSGPIMNMNAGVDFARVVLEETLDGGSDPLAPSNTSNEVLDGAEIEQRIPVFLEPEPEPEPEPGSEPEP